MLYSSNQPDCPSSLCGCAAHTAASQGACSPLGADFQVWSIHSTHVIQGDPITPWYGKGQAGSSWLSRILTFSGPCCCSSLQPAWACEEILGLVPGKQCLQGMEAMPIGSSEPMFVLQVHLVFAQQFSALIWKHNILLCYLGGFRAACLHAYQTVHQEPLAVTLPLGTSVNFFPHSARARARAGACHFFFLPSRSSL